MKVIAKIKTEKGGVIRLVDSLYPGEAIIEYREPGKKSFKYIDSILKDAVNEVFGGPGKFLEYEAKGR